MPHQSSSAQCGSKPHAAEAAHPGSRQSAHRGWVPSSVFGHMSESPSDSGVVPSFSTLLFCGSCLHVTEAREESFTVGKEFTPGISTPPVILLCPGREEMCSSPSSVLVESSPKLQMCSSCVSGTGSSHETLLQCASTPEFTVLFVIK